MPLPDIAHRFPGFASHVQACVSGNYAVFMDLRSGRYFGIRCQRAAAASGRMSSPGAAPPLATLADLPTSVRTSTGCRDLFRFILCLARAAFDLRWRTFERVVGRIRRRKRLAKPHAIMLDELRALLWRFDDIRPLFFPREDRCLLHSLALIHFLAHHGVFPELILGVSTEPFRAHSWVQYGSHVLTCSAFEAEAFTPILVV